MVFKIVRLDYNPLIGKFVKYSDIFDKDIPRLKQFLKIYSPKMQYQVRNKLIHFNEWLKGKFVIDNLLKVSLDLVEVYFDEVVNVSINNRGEPIKLVSKNKWRSKLNAYYEYVKKLRDKLDDKSFERIFKITKKEFVNPIPDSQLYRFDSFEKISLSKIKEKKKRKITYEIAVKLLNHYYYHFFEMFVLLGINTWSGPRIEEIASIKIENIDLENQFFFNVLKRTKNEDTYGIYFFPSWFVRFLRLQIEQKNIKYPGEKWLFPSSRIKNQHITQQQIRKRIHKTCELLDITADITPHKFRALLNTYRKRMGVEPEDRSILLNHDLNSTQAKHYILDYEDFDELRKIYNESFPYPEFKPNPNYMREVNEN